MITRQLADQALPVLLVIVGLGLLCYGLGQIFEPLGYISAGLSCLGAEMWRTERKGQTSRTG